MTHPRVSGVVTSMQDRKLARLIAGRDAPSVLEKEQLFERIYEQVQPSRPPSRLGAWVAAGGVLAAAALALIFVRPSQPEFQARGGGSPGTGPELVVACAGVAECQSGAKLTLTVRSALDTAGQSHSYFAAFARRFDGTIIWYFPEPGARSLELPQTGERALLDRAVLLGGEHLPGHYDVYGVFTRRPLTREELKLAVGEELAGSADAVVVHRSFEVAR